MAKYLDLKPSAANVDEVVLAVYTKLAPFAEVATVLPPGQTASPTYYPGARFWRVWFSVDDHYQSLDPNSPNYGRTLITFDVEQNSTNDRPHADDDYESFLSGAEVELSDPTRTVTIPTTFLTEKPADYIPPDPEW
jgi:hypothetical protein